MQRLVMSQTLSNFDETEIEKTDKQAYPETDCGATSGFSGSQWRSKQDDDKIGKWERNF